MSRAIPMPTLEPSMSLNLELCLFWCVMSHICLVNGTGPQTRAGLAAGLQGYRYRYKISTLAKPVPLAMGIGVGRKEKFKLYT